MSSGQDRLAYQAPAAETGAVIRPEPPVPLTRLRHSYAAQVLLTGGPLLIADLAALLMSNVMAYALLNVLVNESGFALSQLRGFSPPSFVLYVAIVLPVIFFVFNLYPGSGMNPIIELRQTILATISIYVPFMIASGVIQGMRGSLILIAVAAVFSLGAVPATRSVARRVLARFRWWGQPMLIVGDSPVSHKHYRYFADRPYIGLRPIGIVAPSWSRELHQSTPPSATAPDPRLPATAGVPGNAGVYWAMVESPTGDPHAARALLARHTADFPHLLVFSQLTGLPSLWNNAFDCGDELGFQMKASLLLPLPRLIKRITDWSIVLIGGLVCLPILLAIAALIRLTSAGPAFYQQERIGHGGRRFRVWKYRTMVQDADAVLDDYLNRNPAARREWERDSKLKRDPRITRVGLWLRKTSLDELPQLWNVLKGEMSLVGPRPIMVCELEKYRARADGYQLYTRVLPGISGLWQISGRSDTTYEKRIDLDTYYARNWSPWLDLYILARTVGVVVRRQGAY